MTGTQNVDPTTLDYENNNYYFMWARIYDSDNGLFANSGYMNNGLRKISHVTKAIGTYTSSNGNKYKAITYTITGYPYSQKEIENDKSDKGIYQMNDEYGTSYYYRGSVNNNYVLFGGHYWRIIRINGDGSIRLLYAGTKKDAKGKSYLQH